MAVQPVDRDELQRLLDILPARIASWINRDEQVNHLVEIVLDLGRVPETRFVEGFSYLEGDLVSQEDLDHVVRGLGQFGGDNRAGIASTLHRISAIRNRGGAVIGLTCRVGRAVYGTAEIIRDVVESGQSILLLGRPGVGKTTMLRELARILSDEMERRVVIVDTSNEIGGDGDIPHPAIGHSRRMQVPRPEYQHGVMIEAVENHMPQVIVIDEIGTELEAQAARTIGERGVQLVGTAHGISLENLILNPTLSDLIGGIQAVTLGDEEARRRRTRKTVLERKSQPTFHTVVEIQEKNRLAVHHNVADVVDALLREVPPSPEIRVSMDDGAVQIIQSPAPEVRPEPVIKPEPLLAEPYQGNNLIRIYSHGVSQGILERLLRVHHLRAEMVKELSCADVVMALKAMVRKDPQVVNDAERAGKRVVVVRSNTVTQIEGALREVFRRGLDPESNALQEAEQGVHEALASENRVELSPQTPNMRRLQHELVERYGLKSRSTGAEPRRRVVIFP